MNKLPDQFKVRATTEFKLYYPPEYIVYWKILYCAPDGTNYKERKMHFRQQRKERRTLTSYDGCLLMTLSWCLLPLTLLLVLYHLSLSEGCNISLHLSRDRGNTSLSSALVWSPQYCQGTIGVSIVSRVCSIIQYYIDFRLEHNTHRISIIAS